MAKLLLVEDDSNIRETLAEFLTFEHHQVETACDFQDAQDKLFVSEYDLLILDWQLPDGTGIDILRDFRSKGGLAPVLMLTGKSALADKETGFNAGSDDYLTKPFELKELLMRVQALLRRPRSLSVDQLKIRDIVLDTSSYRVTKGGKEISLLPREFALLEFFMRNPNRVFSAEALLDRVWASASEASTQAVVVCMRRLRQKIETEGEKPIIRTIYSVGYKLEP